MDLNMRKVLKVQYPETVTCFPRHGNLLSIISCNEKYVPWFHSNYIQLEIKRDFELGCFLDFYAPNLIENCPWIYAQRIARDLVQKFSADIVDFLINAIDSEYYVYTMVNTFYIPEHSSYGKRKRSHELLIYGYDREKRFFYIADNFPKYKYAIATFDEIKNSYDDNIIENDYLKGINLYKYNYDGKYDLDVVNIVEMFTDYLYSKNTSI